MAGAASQPDQVRRILAAAWDYSPDAGTALLVAAATGWRRANIVGLRWRDVHPDTSELVAAQKIVVDERGAMVTRPGNKRGRIRRTAVDAATMACIETHRVRMTERATACGTVIDGDSYVFSNDPAGRVPWRPDTLTRQWSRIRERAGVPGVRLHDLRHWLATTLLESGETVLAVADRLDHASPKMTLDVYGHAVPAADQRIATAVGDLLS